MQETFKVTYYEDKDTDTSKNVCQVNHFIIKKELRRTKL